MKVHSPAFASLASLLGLFCCSLTLHADPPRKLPQEKETFLDVALNKDFALEGHLIDSFGKVLKGAPVTLVHKGKVIWTGRTDENGRFEVKGLPSGVYRVDSEKLTANCRIWARESAPPKASRSLLLTRDRTPERATSAPVGDELTFRISGLSTFTFPRPATRDVRKLINP